MANTSSIFGAKLVGRIGGGPLDQCVNRYLIPSGDGTATFMGDFVKSGGTSVLVAQTGETLPTIAQAAATNTLRGLVVGFDQVIGVAQTTQPNMQILYRPASTQMVALVCDDPYAIYEIQSNGTGVVGDVGANADIVVGSGSTSTGYSGMQLDESSINTTSTLQLKIIGVVNRPDNVIGASVKYLVMINNGEFKIGVTGV